MNTQNYTPHMVWIEWVQEGGMKRTGVKSDSSLHKFRIAINKNIYVSDFNDINKRFKSKMWAVSQIGGVDLKII